jgi:hypothetical protein
MASETTNLALPLATLGERQFKRSYKDSMEILDDAVGTILTGSKTHDAASIADAANATTTVTVTGAELGDFVVGVSLGVSAAGITVSGYVSAADTVTVLLQNESGGAVDLASTTLAVLVRKA